MGPYGLWFATWRLVERLLYRGRRYTILVPFGNRVLTPWFDESDDSPFTQAHRVASAGGPMAVTADRCYLLHEFARITTRLDGDVAECGVFTGGTAHLLAEMMRATECRATLHLFDSFTGMPVEADPKRDHHGPGDFADTEAEIVRKRLGAYSFAQFHVGFIPETLAELDSSAKFAFVHADMDIYTSTLEACRFFWPRIVPGGAMVFDDYGFFHLRAAARAAVDLFFADQPEAPIVLPTGQAIVFKR